MSAMLEERGETILAFRMLPFLLTLPARKGIGLWGHRRRSARCVIMLLWPFVLVALDVETQWLWAHATQR